MKVEHFYDEKHWQQHLQHKCMGSILSRQLKDLILMTGRSNSAESQALHHVTFVYLVWIVIKIYKN